MKLQIASLDMGFIFPQLTLVNRRKIKSMSPIYVVTALKEILLVHDKGAKEDSGYQCPLDYIEARRTFQ